MNKNILIGIGALVLIIGGGVYLFMGENSEMKKDDMIKVDVSTGKKELMIKNEAVMDKDVEGTMIKGDVSMKTGVYEAYSSEKIARAETGDVVLFFHATWCPSCRSLNSDIEKNMSLIPEGVSILKVDYDKEVELKKKYSVTYQHTLVQVDKNGTMIKKWSGSSSLSKVISQIQ